MPKDIEDMTLPEIKAKIEGMGYWWTIFFKNDRWGFSVSRILNRSPLKCQCWLATELDAARAALTWLREREG